MGNLGLTINSEETPPSTGGEAFPKGDYTVKVVESEVKLTKAGTGTYAEMKFEIVDGPYTGRTFRGRFNLTNPNEKAWKIGRAELSAIGVACGKPHYDDTRLLHDIPFRCKVDVEDGWNVFKRALWKETAGAPMAAQPSAPKGITVKDDDCPF